MRHDEVAGVKDKMAEQPVQERHRLGRETVGCGRELSQALG